MTPPSQAQLDANRRNAQKSTGPRSAAGKARSSQNARRHGLLSREILLVGENIDDLAAMIVGFEQDFKPVGALEEFLLEELVSLAWRLRRFCRVETGIFEELERLRLKGVRSDAYIAALRALGRRSPETQPSDAPPPPAQKAKPPSIASTVFQPGGSALLLGSAFRNDVGSGRDSFSVLMPYSASLRQGFFKTLEKLQQAQHRRRERDSRSGADTSAPPDGLPIAG